MEDRKIVWLPAAIAKKVEDAESQETADKLVLKYCEQVKGDMTESLECLDEDLLRFKGNMAQVRQQFGKAKDEHLNATYAMWEKGEEDCKKVSEHVARLTKQLQPLKTEVEKVNQQLAKIDTYKLQKLLEVVTAISGHLSMNDKTADILSFLTNEYKSEEN
jgi:chromosome segregation ATPase